MWAKMMPHGWMSKTEPYTCRLKMWRVVYLTIGWAAILVLGLLKLWIDGEGSLPSGHPFYWIALAPGPVLIAFITCFRLTEQPCTFTREAADKTTPGRALDIRFRPQVVRRSALHRRSDS